MVLREIWIEFSSNSFTITRLSWWSKIHRDTLEVANCCENYDCGASNVRADQLSELHHIETLVVEKMIPS
jgi:hypothetical protein